MADNGGQFYGLHMIAVDSRGNIYTGEVFTGQRVQRFVPADSERGIASFNWPKWIDRRLD